MRVKLKNVGAVPWGGQDFDGAQLQAGPGDVVEMSEERAKMLVADYPGRFDLVSDAPKPKPTPAPAAPAKPKKRRASK